MTADTRTVSERDVEQKIREHLVRGGRYDLEIKVLMLAGAAFDLGLFTQDEYESWHQRCKRQIEIPIEVIGGAYAGRVGKIHFLDEEDFRGGGKKSVRVKFDYESEVHSISRRFLKVRRD